VQLRFKLRTALRPLFQQVSRQATPRHQCNSHRHKTRLAPLASALLPPVISTQPRTITPVALILL